MCVGPKEQYYGSILDRLQAFRSMFTRLGEEFIPVDCVREADFSLLIFQELWSAASDGSDWADWTLPPGWKDWSWMCTYVEQPGPPENPCLGLCTDFLRSYRRFWVSCMIAEALTNTDNPSYDPVMMQTARHMWPRGLLPAEKFFVVYLFFCAGCRLFDLTEATLISLWAIFLRL